MAITVNTNMQALIVQKSLSSATTSMNTAMERLSTGLKINSAADDAAGLAVSTKLETQISGSKVAQANAQIGASLLTTSEGTLNVIQTNLQRIRDLTEQAANGTYDDKSRTAIKTEILQRASEIDRIAKVTEFNGIKLFDNATTGTNGVTLQVGSGADAATNSIKLEEGLFKTATVSAIGLGTSAEIGTAFTNATTAAAFLTKCDDALTNVTDRKTKIGAFQNRLTSAMEGLKVQETNLSAANSQIKDADVATESSNYVRAQILQQASASLLSAANQSPSIAINLI